MDLEAAIADHERRGYRLDMIMPADNPRIAVVSKGSEMLRLTATGDSVRAEPFTGFDRFAPELPPSRPEFVITRSSNGVGWVNGRAGMQYRDLIPSRLGGRYIASHIRIPDGGPVNDYVHHHRIRFQMIFVRKGWVRVVYQDQGEPFVMHEGDCVLQPPHIRHRVLEASKGLEVIEIGSPAEHETFRDHDQTLPTLLRAPFRTYWGQHFVRDVAASAAWREAEGYTYRSTGISRATRFRASVDVCKVGRIGDRIQNADFFFFYVLQGSISLRSRELGDHILTQDDSCVLPTDTEYALASVNACEILQVSVGLPR
jgi:mannose-6-phosphate isomerase-like protein (cupin superfamily)